MGPDVGDVVIRAAVRGAEEGAFVVLLVGAKLARRLLVVGEREGAEVVARVGAEVAVHEGAEVAACVGAVVETWRSEGATVGARVASSVSHTLQVSGHAS